MCFCDRVFWDGYKWEVFADHIATEQHKQCVKEVVQRFFLVKKGREKKTKLSVIKLNSGPTTVKVKSLANANKPRERIRKTHNPTSTV